MRLWVLTAATFGLLVAGCQSSGSGSAEDERERILAMRPAIDSIPQSGLGPQVLRAGDCGLFLWSKTDVTKFIFFSQALTGTARFAKEDVPMELAQTGAGGNIFGQYNTRMSYQSTDGLIFDLLIEPGEVLDGGQRIKSGMLTTTDSEGWRTKLPILGVRACQPE
ncbi:MAG: hypothetical protein AAFY82_07575 [Pseudomonadota bacterium]